MPHGLPVKHASLSRPRLVPVDALPDAAEVTRRTTPWQHIVKTLVDHPGQWFELTRTYTQVATAVASARKVLETDYDEGLASCLESASMPVIGGALRVYLRLTEAPPADDFEDEDDGA